MSKTMLCLSGFRFFTEFNLSSCQYGIYIQHVQRYKIILGLVKILQNVGRPTQLHKSVYYHLYIKNNTWCLNLSLGIHLLFS